MLHVVNKLNLNTTLGCKNKNELFKNKFELLYKIKLNNFLEWFIKAIVLSFIHLIFYLILFKSVTLQFGLQMCKRKTEYIHLYMFFSPPASSLFFHFTSSCTPPFPVSWPPRVLSLGIGLHCQKIPCEKSNFP